MHELSALLQIVKTVDRITNDEKISRVRYIALEVGNDSGFVPMYLSKLFPAAADSCPKLKRTQLQIITVPGSGLTIKEIGY